MKKLMLIVLLASIGWGVLHAAVDVKSLWHTDKKAKSTIKNLWKKSRVTPVKKVHNSTMTQIETSKTTLEQTQAKKQHKNRQLEKIAKTIRQTEREGMAINKVLDQLEREQKKSETTYRNARVSIDQYGGRISKLDAEIRKRNQAFVHLLADQFALIVAREAINRSTIHTVVQQEVYEVCKAKNNHSLAELKTKIDGNRQAKAKWVKRQNGIKKSIRNIIAKQELYRKKKKEKSRLLAKLAKKEEEYRRQIKQIMRRQDTLRQTLARLNILHNKEIESAKRIEAARRAELKRKTAELMRMRQEQDKRAKRARAEGRQMTYAPPRITSSSVAGSVKQYGSSYQASNIRAYRGARTISPLSHARVVKKFGTYIDPIYKIKIFNDNVVLRASKANAKVRNVLNGKVVYVGKNSMLGKVVIVEHGNRLHTIYAALDRISPMLKNGSRVKKGVIIGRVKRKLIFQATQDSKYINPLRLIRL